MERVALITGSTGSGIGRSVAISLVRDGFSVVLNYKSNKPSADQLSEYINSIGGKSLAVQANIFIKADCDRLINKVIEYFGRIDVVIIGPGAEWNPEEPRKINPEKSLQDIIQEVSPIYSFLPKILPEMEKQKSGRLIAISSNNKFPSPSYSYNTAKSARTAAFLGLVSPCWKSRITVNVVAPGPVEHIDNFEVAKSLCADFSKSQTSITPQDIAEIVSFLCSEKGRYISGNVIETLF